jgi:hypothetical protein
MMISLTGSILNDDSFNQAYDTIVPILDELSLKYDIPLHISHIMFFGVPSGLIKIQHAKPPANVEIVESDRILEGVGLVQLRTAMSLYREAISSPNPFQSFLSFWKVYENVEKIRGDWRVSNGKRRNDKTGYTFFEEERFPANFYFDEDSGKSFGKVREELNGEYRNALAHGAYDANHIRTAANASEYRQVFAKIALVRHIAKVALTNLYKNMNAATNKGESD